MAESFEISKVDAARRQLDTSLKLYFQNQDAISIHTLASAAQNILQDLSKRKGVPTFFVDCEALSVVLKEFAKLPLLNDVIATWL